MRWKACGAKQFDLQSSTLGLGRTTASQAVSPLGTGEEAWSIVDGANCAEGSARPISGWIGHIQAVLGHISVEFGHLEVWFGQYRGGFDQPMGGFGHTLCCSANFMLSSGKCGP